MSNPAPSEQPTVAPLAVPTAEAATLPANNGAPAAPPAVTAIPGYEVLGELGRGGMAVVYKARHLKLDRLVALKMILAGGHAGAAELARFQTEAHAIAQLQHRSTPPLRWTR
jgi:serine/threonine protein kinase